MVTVQIPHTAIMAKHTKRDKKLIIVCMWVICCSYKHTQSSELLKCAAFTHMLK